MRAVTLFVCRLFISSVLLYSAVVHEANPYQFVLVISKYSVTHDHTLLAFAATVLIALHCVLATTLLFDVCAAKGYLLTAALMVCYFAAQTRTLVLGLDIPCGCLSHTGGARITALSLSLPISVFLVALLGAFLTVTGRRRAAPQVG